MLQRVALSIAILILATGRGAMAEEMADSTALSPPPVFAPQLDADYFLDGGVIPFVYGSAVVALGLRAFAEPRETPLLFAESEGGEDVKGDTVPSVVVGIYGGLGAGLVAIGPTEARFHHLKGYSEAMLTTMALTEIAKNSFGRHRPDYRDSDTEEDQRRSFFSGHSSITSATSVYLGLYFYEHVSPKLDGPMGPVYKGLVYALLAGTAVGIPVTRLEDNRHHPSDVITGAVVGTALSAGFFVYQESRFRSARDRFYGETKSKIVLLPDLQNRGFTLSTRW